MMIINLKKTQKLIKKNLEISFLCLLTLLTIVLTTFYNDSKKKINENYKDVINNIYFLKTVNHI